MFLPLLQILRIALPTQYHVLSYSQGKNKTKNENQKRQTKNPNKTQNKHAPNKSLLLYFFSAWDMPWSVVDMPSDTPL